MSGKSITKPAKNAPLGRAGMNGSPKQSGGENLLVLECPARKDRVLYYSVFPVKACKALLDEEVVGILQETAAEIADRFPMEMEAIGTDKHHTHVLCRAHPKMAPGRIVQIFKSLTARESSFGESRPSNGCCGVGNLGQMGTL